MAVTRITHDLAKVPARPRFGASRAPVRRQNALSPAGLVGIWSSGVPNAVGGPVAPGRVNLMIVHLEGRPTEVFGLNPGHGLPVFVDVGRCMSVELRVDPALGQTVANTPRAGAGAALWVTVLVPPPAGCTAADLTSTAPQPAIAECAGEGRDCRQNNAPPEPPPTHRRNGIGPVKIVRLPTVTRSRPCSSRIEPRCSVILVPLPRPRLT